MLDEETDIDWLRDPHVDMRTVPEHWRFPALARLSAYGGNAVDAQIDVGAASWVHIAAPEPSAFPLNAPDGTVGYMLVRYR